MASNVQTPYFRTDFPNPIQDSRVLQRATSLRILPQFYQLPTVQPIATLPQVRATAAPTPLSQGYGAVYHQPFCGFYPSQATPYYTGQAQPVANSFYSYSNSYISGGTNYYGQPAPQVIYPQGGYPSAPTGYYGQPAPQVFYPQGYSYQTPYYSSSYTQQPLQQSTSYTAPATNPVSAPANNSGQPPAQVITKPPVTPPTVVATPTNAGQTPAQVITKPPATSPTVVVTPNNSNNATILVPPKTNPSLLYPPSQKNEPSSFDPVKDSSTGKAGGAFGKTKIDHGATINDFFPNWPPKNPRENMAYFGAACQEYKKYCGVTSLGNCDGDITGFGGDVAHDLLGIQQKNAFVLSEYLDDPTKLPFLANYKAMIKSAIDYANANGSAVIQLSGHGTQLPIKAESINDRINPIEIAHIPVESYETDGKVECQYLLDGGFYLDREFLAALSHLNEGAFLLVMFDNCHDGFDFPRVIFGDGTIQDKSMLNGVIKGCVTFLGTSKQEQTSSDGAPNMEFPAGAGAGTAAFADTIMRLSAAQGIDKITFKQLATTAQQQLPQGQTLSVGSSFQFDPDELVPLTPEGAKAFMEKHKAAIAV